jgi:phosphoribosylglycinamide formyltransferase-1
MINIHPSLLPKYPGLHTHERALAAGETLHGSSVHYVSAELDGGPVIAQAELPIALKENSDALAARLLPLEHHLLIGVVGLIASGRVALGPEAVEVDGQPLSLPLRMNAQGALAIM